MRCTECDGELQIVEEVMGSFAYPVKDDGMINFDDKEYYGESWTNLKCSLCEKEYDYEEEFQDDGNSYITEIREVD